MPESPTSKSTQAAAPTTTEYFKIAIESLAALILEDFEIETQSCIWYSIDQGLNFHASTDLAESEAQASFSFSI